ncbi:MAG: TrpR-related protein YerC/YecD [Clostridia bacterium]|nr:TrpR-related protein YerC/YecD [Clostridia bacterium]
MLSDNKDIKNLYELILSLESVDDCEALFKDLCTEKEVEQMSQRVKAARLLMDGKTYNQVMEQCEISSATLSRVSRCVQYGNGYKNFIK